MGFKYAIASGEDGESIRVTLNFVCTFVSLLEVLAVVLGVNRIWVQCRRWSVLLGSGCRAGVE